MKKQAIVILSSIEAKYIIDTLPAKRLWFWFMIQALDNLQISKINLYYDSQSCVNVTKNPKLTNQNKHIQTWYHFKMYF